MTFRYSESEVIDAIDRLTRTRLTRFVQAEIVMPVQTETGPQFGAVDLARLELLCELSDEFDLNEDALGLVISLVDQLHSTRTDLRNILTALENEADEVRDRIGQAWLARCTGPT
jgi:chaperone modulatory protein CbpM